MNSTIGPGILLSALLFGATSRLPAQTPTNFALHAKATASSTLEPKFSASKAVDGETAGDSRWVSERKPGPHTLVIDLGAKQTIGCVQLHSGWYSGWQWVQPATNFVIQAWDGRQWADLPETRRTNNHSPAHSFVLAQPVATDKLRFVTADQGGVRVVELRAFAPSATGYPPALITGAAQQRPFVASLPAVFVNQSGYNLDWPKRFTAPRAADGTEFVITATNSDQALFRGKVNKGVGDFTEISPPASRTEYIVKLLTTNKPPQTSDPFSIAPLWMGRVSLEPALRFMVDCRAIVGTHPSAFGGCPWRDATYYSFEVPSLVMLYLANPDFFEQLPVEISYSRDQARVLAPDFKTTKEPNDDGALDTARRYYRELDPPMGERVPDLVQLFHWGIGYYLLKPGSHDPSGDARGGGVHAQTVEQFAFFLYGYPHYARYFTGAFHQRAHGFAFEQWEKAGLFNVLTNIGDFKGRECPGHSILPNLLMYEVAKREGRADAERFMQAAVNQTRWVVEQLDLADPRVTKGQRMSEHKLVPGLVMLLRDYPDHAPTGLKAKLQQWVDLMIARSDNLWDFRRYDDQNWTLPRFTPGSHGGAGWNEPGNVAAFPALCFAVASVLDDPAKATRLRQIAAAHWDDLFGRNPLGAHSAFRGPKDFAGVERGWPVKFPDNTCARLELVRGALNSTAASEHYPFNPQGDFRHPEGWTAFNAAWNVGLAYTCWEDTRVSLHGADFTGVLTTLDNAGQLGVQLVAPVGVNPTQPSTATVVLTSSSGDRELVTVREPSAGSASLRGTIAAAWGTAKAGDGVLQAARGGEITAAYGGGFLQRRAKLAVK
ncbi:MAG: discoidin domain-containing protein [Verrucomicrobia bacterium]|nr:discoidin domain-containing protein [Verrucomicrobiota bacterium]